MFTLKGVSLRPLDFEDIDTLYEWSSNIELEMLAGWGPQRSRAAYRQRYEKRIAEPEKDLYVYGVETEGKLVGYVQLAMIDREEKRAAAGLVIGEKEVWGRGIGKTALCILLDYAFTPLNLERVYSEVYDFNKRSQRLMESVGFTHEGILRQHEIHNGKRQDMYVFGILKDEFYQIHETIFKLPSA